MLCTAKALSDKHFRRMLEIHRSTDKNSWDLYRVIMKENCSLVAVTSIMVYGYPDWNVNAVPVDVHVGQVDDIRIVAFAHAVGWNVGPGYAPVDQVALVYWFPV